MMSTKNPPTLRTMKPTISLSDLFRRIDLAELALVPSDIVSVQPLSGPTCQPFFLKYKETLKEPSDTSHDETLEIPE